MKEFSLLEAYKEEIRTFLATMDIYVGDKIINNNPEINAKNKEFIKNHMQKMFANNLNVDILNKDYDMVPYH